MSEPVNTTAAPSTEAQASEPTSTESSPKVKGNSKFHRAMRATGRGIKRGSTDLGVWTTATVLTIAEPIKVAAVAVAHTADAKEDSIREAGRRFIERRHARLVKEGTTEVEQLKAQLAKAEAALVEANQQVVENPAPESAPSLRPQPSAG